MVDSVRSGKAGKPEGEPAGTNTSTLINRIHARYEEFPESERKVADLIINFPGEVAAYNATELAELAGSSKAAVSRLVRRLGYASFDEARRAARTAQDWGSPLYLLHKSVREEGFEARVRTQLERDILNLSRTLEMLEAGMFSEIVEALHRADRLWVLGFRNSYFLAGYARWQFIQVRDEVHLLPAAGETLAEYLAQISESDALIVIGFRRRVPEIERVIEIATGRGAQVLLITDMLARTRGHHTWTIRCETRGDDLFDHYAAAMSLLHLLSVELVSRTGAPGRRRLELIEEIHEALDDFR